MQVIMVILKTVCRAVMRLITHILSVAMVRSTNLVELMRSTQDVVVFCSFQ